MMWIPPLPVIIAVVALLFTHATPKSSGADVDEAVATAGDDDGTASDATQLMQVFEVVLEHHLEPPTRQQMVHDAIREIYRRREVAMPATLAEELSDATEPDGLLTILQRELRPLGDLGSDGIVNRLPHRLPTHGVRVKPSKAHAVDQQLAANRYVGIGITLSVGSSQLPTMHSIVEGGSADQAGARKGDEIVEIDGEPTTGKTLEAVIDAIRGPEGTDVQMVLRREGFRESVTMKRAVVPLTTVEPPIRSRSGRIVGVKIERIAASNLHELRKIEAELDSQVETVTLDFRYGQGSENLHHGELLANALIDNATVGGVVDRDGRKRILEAEPGALFSAKRRYVIINERTIPVLKWIAAALQDTGQATLIGRPAIVDARVVESFSIAAGTVIVSVPTRVLSRAGGVVLVSDPGVASQLMQIGADAAMHRVVQGIVPLGSPPIVRPANVRGVVYPDEPIPGPHVNGTGPGRFRHRYVATAPLGTIVERLDRPTQSRSGDDTSKADRNR